MAQGPQDGHQARRGGGADVADPVQRVAGAAATGAAADGAGAVDRAAGARLRVDVRYFAGAAAAAGLDEEVVLLEHGATVADLLEHLGQVHPPLVRVLAVATALVDEVAVTDRGAPLRDGAQVDVLPPFAGG